MTTVTDRLNGISTSVAVKPPCKAVAIANITLLGAQTVNGVAVVSGDRVLVTNQEDATENGIYVVSTSAWARAADFDGNRDVRQGTLVIVYNALVEGALYEVTTADPIVIGSSAINFALKDAPNITYDQTAAEIAALFTPASYKYPPAYVERAGADPEGLLSSESAFDSAPHFIISMPDYEAPTYRLTDDHDNVLLALGTPTIVGGGSIDIRDLTKAVKSERQKAGRMELIAHRGFRNQGTQNTLIAMTMALRRGADALECDVQPSADGTLYLFHDLTVDSLTDGTGTFVELTDATITGLEFAANAGTTFESLVVTRFDTFLAFARSAGVHVYPEIKAYRTQADVSLIVAAIVAAGMEHLCTLTSFDMTDLALVRSLNRHIGVGLAGDSTSAATYESNVEDLANLGNAMLVWDNSSLLSTPAIVDYAYRRGVGVSAWTVNREDVAAELMALGVYKIMSDVSLLGSARS